MSTWSRPSWATRCGRWRDAGRLHGRRAAVPRRRISTGPGSRRPPPTIPAVTAACSSAGEARRVWVNGADDPGELFVYADVGGPAGRPRRRGRHRRAQPGARRLAQAHGSPRSSGPSTRSCSTCSPRPGKRCGRPGVRPRTPIGNGPSIPASLDLVRAGRTDEAEGAARLVSLIVVGLNHRTVPGRAARAHDGRARRACRRRSTTSLRREHLPRSSCSPRATAPRSTPARTQFHPAVSDVRDFLADTRASIPTTSPTCSTRTTTTPRSRTCSRSPPGSTR